MRKLFFSFLITLAISLPPSLVMAGDQALEESSDGLELVKKKWRTKFYLDTGADWSSFTKVQLEKATVDFRKHWVRD